MSLPPAKYTPTQRDAVSHAVEDRHIAPADVARLAAAGELVYDGVRLEPFQIPAASVRTYAARLRQRRAGKTTSALADQPPRDAVEVLRRRLVTLADDRLNAVERQRKGTADPEQLRQIARAVREIAAIPAPTDPRPAAPGARVAGKREGAETKGGQTGALLQDHRRTQGRARAPEREPAPDAPPHHDPDGRTESTEPTISAAAHHGEHADQPQDDGTPGSVVRAYAEELEQRGVLGQDEGM